MKGRSFNSLGAAFDTAKKETERLEKERTPIFLIVGLDFGTAFTKCMVRDRNYRRAYPVTFTVENTETHFLPSELAHVQGELRHPLDSDGEQTVELPFLKMALIAAVNKERNDWLDGVLRALPAEINHTGDKLLRALVTFYLFRVLQEVQRFIGSNWKGFGSVAGDTVFYNLAVPVANVREQSVSNAFRDCLTRAVSVLESKISLPSSLSDLLEFLDQPAKSTRSSCELLPEVTANIQSYVRSRAGRRGLYLFADVGAGTIDYSCFIFFDQNGDTHLSYPHAAVEYLGSSHLELRTYQRCHSRIVRHIRGIKEGDQKNRTFSMDLSAELELTRKAMAEEITQTTTKAIYYVRKKIPRNQFQTMEILFGGGGCSPDPYQRCIAEAFAPQWGLRGVSQPLPVPADVDWPSGRGGELFRRFSVAYGLSFLPTDFPIQIFPDEIDEIDPSARPRRDPPSAPTKDEV